MIKKGKSLLGLGLALLALAACGSMPNKGIEVGNPDLKGKVLTLTPKDLVETFLLDFQEAQSVLATRIVENQFETIPANFEDQGDQYDISATFADGTSMEVILTFDEADELIQTELFLDGQAVELESSDLQPKAFRRPDFKQAALGVATQLCSRLVECEIEADDGSCTETLLDLPGLAPSLGGTGAQTIREMQEELESGALTADEASLESCFWEISQMPCVQVHEAGPVDHPQADQNVRKMVPRPSCAAGFRK